ncbi:putative MULE transposase domain-containing protein [Helianthus annuus]|nr:putative MULE transposase domain-containing protein [Helianthus annuus]
MINELGYSVNDHIIYHYLNPKKDMDNGIEELGTDSDVLRFSAHVEEHKLIELYTTHGLTNIKEYFNPPVKPLNPLTIEEIDDPRPYALVPASIVFKSVGNHSSEDGQSSVLGQSSSVGGQSGVFGQSDVGGQLSSVLEEADIGDFDFDDFLEDNVHDQQHQDNVHEQEHQDNVHEQEHQDNVHEHEVAQDNVQDQEVPQDNVQDQEVSQDSVHDQEEEDQEDEGSEENDSDSDFIVDGIYPVCYAIVEAENINSWTWFLELLGDDLDLHRNSNFTFVSDRQKDILQAVNKLYPNAEHRYCLRHIHENMKVTFKGNLYKEMLWKCACATTVLEFQIAMDELKAFNKEAHLWLSKIPPLHWSRSYFSGRAISDVLLNNMCEVYNGKILDGRDKPIISALEYIREYLMRRIVKVLKVIEKSEGLLNPLLP